MHTLFSRRHGDEQAWRFVTAILKAWDEDRTPISQYEPGSAEPTEADGLLGRDGRRWKE